MKRSTPSCDLKVGNDRRSYNPNGELDLKYGSIDVSVVQYKLADTEFSFGGCPAPVDALGKGA